MNLDRYNEAEKNGSITGIIVPNSSAPKSSLPLVSEYQKRIVAQALSKSRSPAGLRVGRQLMSARAAGGLICR